MGFQVFQLFSAVVTGQVDAVPAGIGGQTAAHSQSGIYIQKRDLFFRCGLSNQVVVQTHPVIIQVSGAAGGGDPALVHGGYGLGVDHGLRLAGAHGINDVAVGLVKGICVDIAQLVDAEAQIDLGVLAG